MKDDLIEERMQYFMKDEKNYVDCVAKMSKNYSSLMKEWSTLVIKHLEMDEADVKENFQKLISN